MAVLCPMSPWQDATPGLTHLYVHPVSSQAVPPILLILEKPQHLTPSQKSTQFPNVNESHSFKITHIEGEMMSELETGQLTSSAQLPGSPLPATVWCQAGL